MARLVVPSMPPAGGTQHITQSKDTVQSRAASGTTSPDFGGAIRVAIDGVAGVDIIVPVYQFSETHYRTDLQVTGAYKGAFFTRTGKAASGYHCSQGVRILA